MIRQNSSTVLHSIEEMAQPKNDQYRFQRRDRKQGKRKGKMPQHGGSIRRVYPDSINKRKRRDNGKDDEGMR